MADRHAAFKKVVVAPERAEQRAALKKRTSKYKYKQRQAVHQAVHRARLQRLQSIRKICGGGEWLDSQVRSTSLWTKSDLMKMRVA